MSNRIKTVTSKLAQLGLECARDAGIGPLEFQRRTGISELEARTAGGRISAEKHIAMLNLIERLPGQEFSNDQMRAIAAMAPFSTTFGVIFNSRTLHEAFENFLRIRPLIGEVDALQMREDLGQYEFTYALDSPADRTSRAAYGNLAVMVMLARQYTGNDKIFATFELTGKPFPGWQRLQDNDGSKMLFERPQNRLVLSIPSARVSYELHNKFAFDAICGQALTEVKALQAQFSFAARVLALTDDIVCNMSVFAPESTLLALVCDRLAITRSGLHKRLQKEETNFQSIMTQVRMARAKQLLMQDDTPVSVVSDLLGFSSVSVFSRFFSGQSGVSPSRFRLNEKPDA
ncbi:AraC family transcriptional regulator [Silvimonas amylolytica]|uniref:HTH araC/xylS-type domain-containing protein n=1 Tax=Silvimonas amylolytica TaxID=449663 RepID=A0ABQ2PHL7_9NEIS|nr:AraC family transcriptional regulator [Silvimonas amylolytica]GGP24848.1 hypothetical protein GCM10010971_06670 [Silvimonas amylolytica]